MRYSTWGCGTSAPFTYLADSSLGPCYLLDFSEQPVQSRPHLLNIARLPPPPSHNSQRQPDQRPPIRRRPNRPFPQLRGEYRDRTRKGPPGHEPAAPVAVVVGRHNDHGGARADGLLRELHDPRAQFVADGRVERVVEQRPQRRLAPALEPALEVERELVVGVPGFLELNQGREVGMSVSECQPTTRNLLGKLHVQLGHFFLEFVVLSHKEMRALKPVCLTLAIQYGHGVLYGAPKRDLSEVVEPAALLLDALMVF